VTRESKAPRRPPRETDIVNPGARIALRDARVVLAKLEKNSTGDPNKVAFEKLKAVRASAETLEPFGEPAALDRLCWLAVDIHELILSDVQTAISHGTDDAIKRRAESTPVPAAAKRPARPRRAASGAAGEAVAPGAPPLAAGALSPGQGGGAAPPPGDERPGIQIKGGELPRAVDEAEAALIASAPDMYRYGGQLMRPIVEEALAADERRTMIHRLLPVTRPYLVERFTKVARWQRYDRRSETWVNVDCPDRFAESYLARAGGWRLPVLVGIINAPMLRADGSILDRPGYDARTGLLFRSDGVVFDAVPDRPTKQDAERALLLIEDLVSTFPFVDDADRSVALSAVLSVMDRRAVDVVPLHAFSAPAAGTGKTLLVDLCSLIATGQVAPVLEQSKDDIETDKRLLAALVRGRSIVAFDNVNRPLDSALLCQALTAIGMLQLRLLGSSHDVDVPNTAMFYATGNNLILSGDLTRRALVCRLDAECERPEEREFTCDPRAMVREDRPAYVVAALTVLRAHLISGEPTTVAALGSYEGWSNRVRSALIWLGRADPCATMASLRRSDPVTSQLTNLIAAWQAGVGAGVKITTQALLDMAIRVDQRDGAYVHTDLRDALLAIAGEGREINGRRLGRWLSKNEGRVINGHRIVRAAVNTSAVRWTLEEVKTVGAAAGAVKEKEPPTVQEYSV